MRRIEKTKMRSRIGPRTQVVLNPVYPAHPCSTVLLVPFKPKVSNTGLLVMDFKKAALLNRMATLLSIALNLMNYYITVSGFSATSGVL